MSEVDLVILGILALSALISFMRGFFREAMSLAIWLAAVVITLAYTDRFSTLLPIEKVESHQARSIISALLLFTGTMLIGNLINWVLERALARKSMGIAERSFGACFGIVRGMIVVTLLVLAANLVPELKQQAWWASSNLLPEFQRVAGFVHARLPEVIGQHFDFSSIRY